MFGWRKRNDGFEWRDYVRTTILVRRKKRRDRVGEVRKAAVENLKAAGQRGAAAGAEGAKAMGRGAVHAGQQGAMMGAAGAKRMGLGAVHYGQARAARWSGAVAGAKVAGSRAARRHSRCMVVPAAVRRGDHGGSVLCVGRAAHDRWDRVGLPGPAAGARRSRAAPAKRQNAFARRRQRRASRRHHPRLRQRLRARHLDRAADRRRHSRCAAARASGGRHAGVAVLSRGVGARQTARTFRRRHRQAGGARRVRVGRAGPASRRRRHGMALFVGQLGYNREHVAPGKTRSSARGSAASCCQR